MSIWGLFTLLPSLWFLPVMLFRGFIVLEWIMFFICLWVMWKLISIVYYDYLLTQGMLMALAMSLMVFYCPPLWFIWYYNGPRKERLAFRDRSAASSEVLPAWEEHTFGRWMERRGWERAKDSLHVEHDLLAGKSKAAVAAHLEREISQLPAMVPKAHQGVIVPEETVPAQLPEFEPAPWEALGLKTTDEKIDERMERAYEPPPPPEYIAPQIDGVSDYQLTRLYGEGKFDEVVAYLSTRLRVLRDRGADTEPVEDYLRIARAQQLHRELEKYRREYDDEALLGGE